MTFTGELLNASWGPATRRQRQRDNEVAASYIAKMIAPARDRTDSAAAGRCTATGRISDLYEENDTGSNTAFRGGNYGLLLKGDPPIPTSFDVAKPAFNAFRLAAPDGRRAGVDHRRHHRQRRQRRRDAAADSSALQILVYNHTDGGAANAEPTSTLVNLTVNNLPFGTGPLRVRQYIVDHTHANAYTTWVGQGSPAKPTQAQWSTLRDAAELCYYDTTVTPTGSSVR